MLLFAVVEEHRLADVRAAGLRSRDGGPVRLWSSLKTARLDEPAGAVLVVDAARVAPEPAAEGEETARDRAVTAVPASAILNLDPYLPARTVTAGGGYVMCDGALEPEVLMIYRNGCWDLPKGKLEDGETPETGALREVREEVGIERLRLVAPFGTTVHGYARGGTYWVKTTFWYRMATEETTFTPQAEEGIERVEWVPWSEAHRRVGYDSLRNHMADLDPGLPTGGRK